MKCSDARHLIHLSVGDDNLSDEEQVLGEHLHQCSECRSYNAGMVDAMQVLYDFRDNTMMASDLSVWASVERRIEDRRSLARASELPQRQFHGGIIALCACSLVLAFVTIVNNLPVNHETADSWDPNGGMSQPNITPVNLRPMNNVLSGHAMPKTQSLVRLVDPESGKVWLQDPITNRVFENAVRSRMIPVDSGAQNW
ncbi:MAG: zf-HC2 domain-containing protein [Fuerstiella sp.]|nr:zf-HC2 domain-containing protein [Fuerstiella sp.]